MVTEAPADAVEAVLVRRWHGHESVKDIADDLKLKPHELERRWRQLKREGKLPDGPRQYNRPQPPIDTDRHDGRPSVDGAWYDDPLLAALQREHGMDGRPDIFPGLKKRRRR